MKKLLGVLLLAVLLTFGAGCVTSADEIIGTWQTHEVFEGVTETTTQILFDDGTGTVLYEYFDGDEEVYPARWTKMSDGTYLIEEFYSYTFPEDQKTMTDNWGNDFSLEEGAEKIGGIWREVTDESDSYYTVVFNEDGTGVETLYEEGDEPVSYEFAWKEVNENQIAWWSVHTYPYTEDGRLDLGGGVYLTLTDGVWIGSPKEGDYTITAEILDDAYLVIKLQTIETQELEAVNWYLIRENGEDGIVVDNTYAYTQTLQADGTILCDCGDVYTKVTT